MALIAAALPATASSSHLQGNGGSACFVVALLIESEQASEVIRLQL
jgi:hypothetical protein